MNNRVILRGEIDFLDLFREGRRVLLFDPLGGGGGWKNSRTCSTQPTTCAGGEYPCAGEPLTPISGAGNPLTLTFKSLARLETDQNGTQSLLLLPKRVRSPVLLLPSFCPPQGSRN